MLVWHDMYDIAGLGRSTEIRCCTCNKPNHMARPKMWNATYCCVRIHATCHMTAQKDWQEWCNRQDLNSALPTIKAYIYERRCITLADSRCSHTIMTEEHGYESKYMHMELELLTLVRASNKLACKKKLTVFWVFFYNGFCCTRWWFHSQQLMIHIVVDNSSCP